MFLDIAVFTLFALICVYLLMIIFRQEREIKAQQSDIEGMIDAANAAHLADANGTVRRGPGGRFVSAKG